MNEGAKQIELKLARIEAEHPVPWRTHMLQDIGRIYVTDANNVEVPLLRLLSYTMLQTQLSAAQLG